MSNVVAMRSNRVTAIIPRSIEDIARISKGVVASGLAPETLNTEEKVMIAIMHGLEIGLPPMVAIQKIAVVNKRPAIFGDAIPALLWSHNFSLSEEAIEDGHRCTVVRPDGTKITRQFTIDDAKRAKLWGKSGPWQQYPQRMLQMRARGLAARDGAADVLSGMYLAEEAQDIPAATEPADITPPEPTEPSWLDHDALQHHDNRPSVYKYKKEYDGELYTEIVGQAVDCETIEKLKQIPDLYSDELLEMPLNYVKLIRDELEEREKCFNQQAATNE